jgi:hypothetical protein
MHASPDARPPTERHWLITCLILWVLLIPVSAWLAGQSRFAWKVVGGPVNALVGALGAVVIGGFLFQRWQRRIESERELDRRTEWLHRNLEFAFSAQDGMRATLAELASAAYRAVALPLQLDQIRDSWLRHDVICLPSPKPDIDDLEDLVRELAKSFDETNRLHVTGPLATAEEQVSQACDALTAAETETDLAQLDRIVGTASAEQPPAEARESDTPHFTEAQVTALLEAFDEKQVQWFEELAQRVLALTGDMTGTKDFEPKDIRKPAIELVVAVQSIAAAVRSDDGNLPQSRQDQARNLTFQVSRLLETTKELRSALLESTRGLMTEAQAVGGMDSVKLAFRQMAHANLRIDEPLWDLWRQHHGFAIDRHGQSDEQPFDVGKPRQDEP